MRRTFVWTAAVLALTGALALNLTCNNSPVEKSSSDSRDGVLIHVSHGSDDPQRALMALRMAEAMSEDQEVVVYFDIGGIDVVLAEADDLSYAQFPTSKAQLAKLLDLGVKLYACPGCLDAAGKTSADLADGIQVASKDALVDFADGRIVTLDY